MRIREWRKDKDAIEELKAKPKGKHRERLDGGGRKGFAERLDDLLLEWIYGRRANGLRVSRKLIKVKARQIYDENCSEDEKESYSVLRLAGLIRLCSGMVRHFVERRQPPSKSRTEPSIS